MTGAKPKITRAREHEWPICRWCKKELREILYKDRGWLTSVTVYWCPHCRSVLGASSTFNA